MVKDEFTIATDDRNCGLVNVSSRNKLMKNQRGRLSKEKKLQNWINTLSNCEISGMGLGLGNDILVKSHLSFAESENSSTTHLFESFTPRDTGQNSV